MAIIINFTKQASEQDTEDLRILLEDIGSRYHFNWFVSNGKESLLSPQRPAPTSKENVVSGNIGDNNHSSIGESVDDDFKGALSEKQFERKQNQKLKKFGLGKGSEPND